MAPAYFLFYQEMTEDTSSLRAPHAPAPNLSKSKTPAWPSGTGPLKKADLAALVGVG